MFLTEIVSIYTILDLCLVLLCPQRGTLWNSPVLIPPFSLGLVQLALGAGEHPLAAAPVRHAEGGHSGVFGAGEGGSAGPGALFGRLGPHAPDRGAGQGPVGPLLQNDRSEFIMHCRLWIYIL